MRIKVGDVVEVSPELTNYNPWLVTSIGHFANGEVKIGCALIDNYAESAELEKVQMSGTTHPAEIVRVIDTWPIARIVNGMTNYWDTGSKNRKLAFNERFERVCATVEQEPIDI